MKKIVSFILATILILAMVSCESQIELIETEEPCPDGHVYKIKYTNTCESDGYKIYTCSGCGLTEQKKAKAIGHKFNITKSDLYCYKDGTNTYTCEKCKKQKIESTGAVAHDFINDKCKYCSSPSQPIVILDFSLDYQYSDWYIIRGKAKNVSTLNFFRVKIHFYALQKSGDDYIIVAQETEKLGISDYMYSESILDISQLLSTSSKIDACRVVIEVPSFEKYEIMYYLK